MLETAGVYDKHDRLVRWVNSFTHPPLLNLLKIGLGFKFRVLYFRIFWQHAPKWLVLCIVHSATPSYGQLL